MLALNSLLKRYLTKNQGNVTVIMVAASLPLVVITGGGVDYANSLAAKARLQDAVDSAAISGALISSTSESVRKFAADQAFEANIVGANMEEVVGNLSLNTVANLTTVTYQATAKVETFVLGMLGIDHLDISATAKAGVTMNRSEIAFVLDNTGSMSRDDRMTNLKSSVDSVLSSLLTNGLNASNTKVSIVPFDTQVNIQGVSTSNIGELGTPETVNNCQNLSSLNCDLVVQARTTLCATAPNVSACVTRSRLFTNSYVSGGISYYRVFATSNYAQNNGGCWVSGRWRSSCNFTVIGREVTYRLSGSTATIHTSQTYSTPWNADSTYAAPDNNYISYSGAITSNPANAGGVGSGASSEIKNNDTITANADLLGVGSANWNGCVIDRTQPYDVSADSSISSIVASLYPAAKCATNNLQPIMGLTTDIASARSHVQKMNPSGNTNLTIGIQWGMEVLSPSLPFNSGVAFNDSTVNKYMIIVTDGQNTQNRWTTTTSQIDARTLLACQAAKDKGITVFTVRVMEGNSSLLQDCATRTDYYYNLTTANQLNGALGDIMTSIRKVRLTQ
jgi:Mg-chelatase subunit ChlD